MVSEKTLNKAEELLETEIESIIKQGTLQNGNGAQIFKNLLESLKIIECIRNGGMEDEGYSGRMMPRYSGNHGDMNYAGNMNFDGTYSGRRSPSTGRYMSRGYSGHSIHDRMIAALEDVYGDAKNQHEENEIQAWIDRLRTNN